MTRQVTGCVIVSAVTLFALAQAAPPGRQGQRTSNRAIIKTAAQRSVATSRVSPSDTDSPTPTDTRRKQRARLSQLAGGGFPTIVTEAVDYRNDEGTRLRDAGLLKGPLPFLSSDASSVANTVACTFDIECDDGDSCTNDRCVFQAGGLPGSGKCENTPAADGSDGSHGGDGCQLGTLCGGCDDGLVCNGLETCQGGVCVAPGSANPATCCSDPAPEGPGVRACSDDLARCDEDSVNVIDVCTSDADCPEGQCDICQPVCANDDDCDDGQKCNGVETCDVGVCRPGMNPCGAGADCDEGLCVGGDRDGRVCSRDGECFPDGLCAFAATPTCYEGRCCRTVDTGIIHYSPEEPACFKKDLAFCTGKGFWYASDEGRHIIDPTEQRCGNNDRDRPGDAWECPKYSSGISQFEAVNPPQYGPPVGPISDSTQSVNIPRAHYDVGGPLNRLGDNYELSNGSYMEIEVLRFVGGMIVPGRILIEIWDDADPPNFVEDLVVDPLSQRVGVIVVPFNPPLRIAPKGWITLRIANTLTPNAELAWLPTSSPVHSGGNTPEQIWVNGGPTASFLNNGEVLAFEIAGNKIDPPVGACCDSQTGVCEGKLSWICKQDGDSFLGVGKPCETCSAGDSTGANCRTCQGGGNDGTACLRDSDCDSNNCATDASVCTGGVCDNDPGMLCTDGGGECGEGSCILSTCQPTVKCTSGACCGAEGACSETVAGSCVSPSTFQGFGSSCDQDDGHDAGVQHCCPQPFDEINPDLLGADDLYDDDCTDGLCWTGADYCEDAITHVVNVPGQGEDPVVITFTGDNSFATNSAEIPDACGGGTFTPSDDRGWWETFQTDNVAMVRIDFCCTQPARENASQYLWGPGSSGEPCTCSEKIHPRTSPYVFGQPSFGHGEPYCAGDDNVWTTFGPLPPGKYALPILSQLIGTLGPYQGHITVEAAPEAACCLQDGSCLDNRNVLECEALGGTYLGPPNVASTQAEGLCAGDPCATGSCCFDPGDCRDLDPFDVRYTADNCLADDGGSFVGGVRCGGGFCEDIDGNLTDVSCSQDADCVGVGVIDCIGSGEELSQPSPCPPCTIQGPNNCQAWDNVENVAVPSDRSIGGLGQRAADDFIPGFEQTTLTQVCVWGEYYGVGDRAEFHDCSAEFVDETTRDSKDFFRVRVYGDADGLPDNNNLIGESFVSVGNVEFGRVPNGNDEQGGIFHWAHTLTLDTPITGLIPGECHWLEVTNDTTQIPTDCNWYWAVMGRNSFVGNGYAASTGEFTSYQPGAQRPWDLGFCLNIEISPGCGDIVRACCECATGDCTETTIKQCRTNEGNFEVDQFFCPAATAESTGGAFACANGPPENDLCRNAFVVEAGTVNFNNFCAETDGYNPLPSAIEGPILTSDLWYAFTPKIDCRLRADGCLIPNNPFGFDSMIALYHDPNLPDGECPCPTNYEVAWASFVGYGDDNCHGRAFSGAGFVETDALANRCYMLRVGSWNNSGRGQGTVDITCGRPLCGNDLREGFIGEECDGIDDDNCPGSCLQDCTCPVASCGDNFRSFGEECDGTDDEECPGRCGTEGALPCQCPAASCGNDAVDVSEECDGFADAACPELCNADCTCGAVCGNNFLEPSEDCENASGLDDECPGRCQNDCTCPPKVCGNDFVDVGVGEECDGLDDILCPGQCRAPGDPAGECTCGCGICSCVGVPGPEPPPANSVGDHLPKNRFISMVIPQAAVAEFHTTAIEVVLTTLNRRCQAGLLNQFEPCTEDADCPGGVCDKPFAAKEGSVRYVNLYKVCDGTINGCLSSADCGGDACVASLMCPDDQFQPDFACAVLGCEPEFRDWAGELAGGTLHVFGEGIVPGRSAYDVAQVPVTCEGDVANCAFNSPSLRIVTSRWGDLNNDGAINVRDIERASNKLTLPPPGAFTKPRIMLIPSLLQAHRNVNVLDLQNTIDAVSSLKQTGLITGPQSCPND